ncbi:hypothetical protein PSTG_05943 [Puccinia striiformis f. sp. tritici PST-78]|uniref:protein-serine/threonine phosphatase n=1 Tax=Puccinia striiformis f. sp. tritici PST-78 TaxID=1165861 RepID=A0A0L0VP43_9BASI|nr:hypothetical protein PSTG_05943 [Puccinia striiformis f. sp. tritici PST-78]
MALNAAPNNTDNQANNNIQDNQPPTSILLPPDINLPITIQYLFVPQQNQTNTHQLQNHNSVLKNTPLFNYYNGQNNRSIRKDCVSVNHNQIINNLESAPDIKTYKSPIKGGLITWSIIEGQVLHEHDGWRTCPIVSIKEPCTHAVQWHGQCAICGSDLTIGDCAGISENSRASVPMLHGPSTLTVSVNEAERLENERELESITKVSKLQLNDGPSLTAAHQEGGGCYYYLEQRPGFLNSLLDKYEMHVYTMGTRAWAETVCKIADPTNQIFDSLPKLTAWTRRSNESSDRPVRAFLGHGRPTSTQTEPSEQLTGETICSDRQVQPLVRQPGPGTARTGRSEDSSDRQVRGLIGSASLRIHWTGKSKDSSDRQV